MLAAKRTSNFTKSEEEKIISLALKYKNVLENKKTDATSTKAKNAAWEKIAEIFNSSSDRVRTGKVLKEKYNNIKRTFRKKRADEKRQLFLTGGGPPPEIKKDPVYEQLHEVMGVSIDGLPSRFDDDEVFVVDAAAEHKSPLEEVEYLSQEFLNDNDENIPPYCETHIIEEDEVAAEVPEADWSNYNPSMLRKKTDNLLRSKKIKQKPITSGDIMVLKKQLLEQQILHNKIEHEQKTKEHTMRVKSMELDIQLKEKQLLTGPELFKMM